MPVIQPTLPDKDKLTLNERLKLGSVTTVFFSVQDNLSTLTSGDGGSIFYKTFSYTAPVYSAIVFMEADFDVPPGSSGILPTYKIFWVVSFSSTPTFADAASFTIPTDEGNDIARLWIPNVPIGPDNFTHNQRALYPNVVPLLSNQTIYAHIVGIAPVTTDTLRAHCILHLLQTGRADL
jgi:hypothetical protein